MNWDAVGAVAELLGGLATVATLAYLAVQIRQNTRSVQASSAATYREGNAAFATIIAQNEELAELYYRGLSDPDSLSEVESHRFLNLCAMVLTYLHEAEELEASDVLSEGLARTRDAQLQFFAAQPGFRKMYSEYRHAQPPKFARRMDAAIESVGVASPPAAQQADEPDVE